MSPATREQLALFATKPRRDLRAADEALARLRAELGDDAVVRAVLRDGHLPEASFGWERLVHVVPAQPAPKARASARAPDVHAVRSRCRRNRVRCVMMAGCSRASSTARSCASSGPYVVSGGWWTQRHASGETHREYHFAELRRGDCLWVYYDRNRRRWFCQGAVE